ncbi:MAG: helicase [Tepidisphaera sp.]|nr:helicase [Tepidisphaera sp.]
MLLGAADILSPGGPISQRLGPGFESRPEQVTMAQAVAAAMESKSHLLVEAGTGVGKSYAYLVPAMLRALKGERVVIATNTIALQEQLVEKDIPLLRDLIAPLATLQTDVDRDIDAPPPGIHPVLVKGRGNYVSVRRLKLASERQDRLFSDPAARRSLHVIEDWAMTTTDGTLSTLPPLERGGVWDKVQSDSGNCMGRRCPTFEQCFYQRARAELDRANLLICNHALFFSDLALRSQEVGFLPEYHHVVLDEAHHVEDVAGEHFGVSLAEGRVAHLLTTLHHARTGKGYLSHLPLLAGEPDAVSRAIRLVEQAAAATRVFFDDLHSLIARGGGGSGGASWTHAGSASPQENSLRLRSPGAINNVLSPAMRELSLRLKALREAVKNEPDRYELNSYAQRAEMIAADAEVLVSQTLSGCAYWGEVSRGIDESRPRITLACAPIEVGPILKERLFRQPHSVILTSATLATRTARKDETSEAAETAFAHVLARLGCEGAKTLQLGSPFDYATQVRFMVDPPAVNAVDDSDARNPLSPLSRTIFKHVRETNGGAFVLFTSFSQLNRCASELAGLLAAAGLPLLAQGRDGSRGAILQRFRENERSVLFGAASFWQGVDVRGQALRNVIITKLPFDPPDRPLTQARYELIESRGGNSFMEDSLPRAVIKFKQGFGRLIRSRDDSGRVVVLDERVLTARYGRIFLASLPKGIRVEKPGD